jgi:hypothetical protein
MVNRVVTQSKVIFTIQKIRKEHGPQNI